MLASSCDTENEKHITSEKDLKEYLLSKNSNFIFNEKKNGNVSRSSTIPEPKYFNSIQELDAFLNRINAADGDFNSGMYQMASYDEDATGGGAGYYHDIRQISAFVYMNIGFNVSNCNGSNLNSWMTGFTLGISYNHTGGNLWKSGNQIYYTARGIMNYNIVFEGIGTIFSENKTYSGYYTCN